MDELATGIGLHVHKHAPPLGKAGDQLVAGLILDLEGQRALRRVVLHVPDGRGQEQLLLGPIHPGQECCRVKAVTLGEI